MGKKRDISYLVDGWADINTMCQKAMEEGWFPEAKEKGEEAYIKQQLRYMASKKNPSTGLPAVASVEKETPEGAIVRVYKQLSLFNADDCQQCYKYHGQKEKSHRKLKNAYADYAFKIFGHDIRLEQSLLFGDESSEQVSAAEMC